MLQPGVPRCVRFGPFELDLRSGELTKNGRRQILPEQPLALLKALVERPGELVTRDELRSQLWPADTFVDFEHGLNAAVKRLREVLGDSADAPRFIETMPRRGYRFIAVVSDPGLATAQRAPLRQRIARPRVRVAATVIVLLGVVGVGLPPIVRRLTSLDWRARERISSPRHLTRLTFGPGLETEATWSPDGRSIAYASDTGGNFDIWLLHLDGSEPIQLTKSPAQDRQPAWSPDGSTIAFRSDREGGGLFVVPASGGAERRLTSFGVRPKWAPDGSQILFASSDLSNGSLTQLFTVRPDGTPPRPVLQAFLKDLQSMRDWNWYPDSRHVSVLADSRKEETGVFTVPLSGGAPMLLRGTSDFGDWTAFEWASSGDVLYVDCMQYWAHNVGRFTVDPGTMKIVSADRITAGDGWEMKLAPSRDSQRLAFTMSRISIRLWTFPFDADTGRILAKGEPVTDGEVYVGSWGLSRDGTKVAYQIQRAGVARFELWMTDLETGLRRKLASDDQNRDTPRWSPDNRRLAYRWCRMPPARDWECAVAIRHLDSDEEQLITTPDSHGFVLPFDWSRDGSYVLASSGISREGLRQRDVRLAVLPLAAAPRAETAVKVLASDQRYQLWQANYSRDGRWICFNGIGVDDPEASAIFVMPGTGADRSRWTMVSGAREWADKPVWSPDGKHLYYILLQGSFFNLWGVGFDSANGSVLGPRFQITHFDSPRLQHSPLLGHADIAVAPHRLILTLAEQTGNIWVLDNVDR